LHIIYEQFEIPIILLFTYEIKLIKLTQLSKPNSKYFNRSSRMFWCSAKSN